MSSWLHQLATASTMTLTAARAVRVGSGAIALQPTAPLLLVPSLATSGRDGRFRLSLLTDVPIALRPVSGTAHTITVDGEWLAGSRRVGRGSAGGCHMEPTWGLNPQYLLTTIFDGDDGVEESERKASLKLTLRRPEAPWEAPMKDKVVDSMIGFYLLEAPAGLVGGGAAASRLKLTCSGKTAVNIVHESCFAPTFEVGCTVQLSAQGPTSFILVPATFGAGVAGPFSIELVCDRPLQCDPLS